MGVFMKHLFAVVLLLLAASPSFGWHTNTHLQMTRDAVSLMPPEFRKMFVEHRKFVEAGITDPDEIVKDWQNHYYIPSPPEGGALDRIDKIVKVIQIKFKSGSSSDVSKQLCYLAHYIGDLWSPESVIKQSTVTDMDFLKNTGLFVIYEGFKAPIEDIRDYLRKRSEWRWRLENKKEISALLYSEAVNDIALVWLTLWQQNGGALEPQKGAYVEHEKGALNVNFSRLLQEEFIEEQDAKWKLAYAPTREARQDALSDLDAINQETARLKETVTPGEETLVARSQAQAQKNLATLTNPKADFYIMECSVKTIGDKAYLIMRIRNNGASQIPSLAFFYPGVRGPVAFIKDLKSGEALKLEGILPAGAVKDNLQIVFSGSTS